MSLLPLADGPAPERSDAARNREALLKAADELVDHCGVDGVTMDAVAARAGVGKSTIYRHWPGKLALVEDAFRTLKAQAHVPESGTLGERVTGFLRQVAQLVETSTYSACMPALIEAAERDPQVRAFHCGLSAERRAVLVELLREAVAADELPSDANPELLADALLGPIVLRRLMLHEPFDPTLVPELVDQVLPARVWREGASRAPATWVRT
jgi:AcrR family transcriptional regulator